MLRDKSLMPLSHQHQHALALCVRIDRASPIAEKDLSPWLTEIGQLFQNEIQFHFVAEENVLFPAACKFNELVHLVEDLRSDHDWLRVHFEKARSHAMTGEEVRALAERLSAHVRKEERLLFERLQQLMTVEELAGIGKKLDQALEGSVQICALPPKSSRPKDSEQ